MKVYSLPDAVPAPVVNYSNYDREKEAAREVQHQAELKAHLISIGYTGKHTGRIYRAQVADGYALYMFADLGAKSCLIHLPYLDAYQDRNAGYLSRKAILEIMDSQDRMDAIFERARAGA